MYTCNVSFGSRRFLATLNVHLGSGASQEQRLLERESTGDFAQLTGFRPPRYSVEGELAVRGELLHQVRFCFQAPFVLR